MGSLARASSPKIRISRSPSWTNGDFRTYKFEISIAGTIWNSFVGRSLSLILVRRKVTALEWITVHAGWWGEIEPAVKTIQCNNQPPKSDLSEEKKLMLTVHAFNVHGCSLRPQLTPDPIKTSHWLGVLAGDMETLYRFECRLLARNCTLFLPKF